MKKELCSSAARQAVRTMLYANIDCLVLAPCLAPGSAVVAWHNTALPLIRFGFASLTSGNAAMCMKSVCALRLLASEQNIGRLVPLAGRGRPALHNRNYRPGATRLHGVPCSIICYYVKSGFGGPPYLWRSLHAALYRAGEWDCQALQVPLAPVKPPFALQKEPPTASHWPTRKLIAAEHSRTAKSGRAFAPC